MLHVVLVGVGGHGDVNTYVHACTYTDAHTPPMGTAAPVIFMYTCLTYHIVHVKAGGDV